MSNLGLKKWWCHDPEAEISSEEKPLSQDISPSLLDLFVSLAVCVILRKISR